MSKHTVLIVLHIIVVLLSLFLIRADNILDLIESNPEQQSDSSLLSTQCELTETELESLIASVPDDSPLQQQQSSNDKYVLIKTHSNKPPLEDRFVQDCRAFLTSLGYKVCSFNSMNVVSASVNISILLEPGHLIHYHGRRDALTLTRFIAHLEQRLFQSPYHTIASKLDKKAYEHILEPKIIAYYPDVTAPGFGEFQKAAKLMAPNPSFFVVHDPQLATKFRLNQPGQLSLVRRSERSQIFFNPTLSTASNSKQSILSTTATDIINWIQANRGLTLHELKDTNIYDPEIHDPKKYQLVAVGDKSSPLGLYFFKILTKTIQNISQENEIKLNPSLRFLMQDDDDAQLTLKQNQATNNDNSQLGQPDLIRLDDIEIVWIDSSQFPNAAFNLKNQYKIESIKNVWFGLIHAPSTAIVTTGLSSVWFDLTKLNLTQSDRQTDQDNIWLVRNWILAVTDRNLNSTNSTNQNQESRSKNPFILEPEPVSVRQGGNFLLECKVINGMSCKWMKDSHLITIDGVASRYRYVVQSETNSGDCSLMINGADVNQDEGEWTCFVTDSTGKQFTSKPIMVQVRNVKSKAEL